MKYSFVVIIIILAANLSNIAFNSSDSYSAYIQEDSIVQYNFKPRLIKGLSLIDESKFPEFPTNSLVDIKKLDYKSLPELVKVKQFDSGEGFARYYCNRSFSNNFKTYILGINEGGDCSPSLYLMNIKGDTLINQLLLSTECAWEHGRSNTNSVFLNDSTFIVNAYNMSNDLIKDSVSYHTISKKYKIGVEGGFVLIENEEEKWITK